MPEGTHAMVISSAAIDAAEDKFRQAKDTADDFLSQARYFLDNLNIVVDEVSQIAISRTITAGTVDIPPTTMDEVGDAPPDPTDTEISPKDPPPDPDIVHNTYYFEDVLNVDVNIVSYAPGDAIVYNSPIFDVDVDVNYVPEVFADTVEAEWNQPTKPEVPVLVEIPTILVDLINNIETKTSNRLVVGSTGLDAVIEAAIWARARSRQELENLSKYTEAENYFSSRGFSIPPGALSGKLNELLIEFARNDSYLNNDIMVEQAKLAMENENHMLEVSTKYLLDRLTESANEIISMNKIKIEKYGADVQMYQADVQAETARIESLIKIYIAKIEVFKTKVMAESARVDALIKVYTVEFEAYKTQAMLETSRVDSLTKLRLSDVEVYKAQVQAESIRVDALIKAFEGQLEAFKGKTSAETSRVESLTRIYLAEVEAYKAERAVEVSRVESISKIYLGKIEGYKGKIQAAASKADAILRGLGLTLQQIQGLNAVEVEEAKINSEDLKNAVVIATDVVKIGAQVSAQIAASAMTSVNASANIGGSGSANDSISDSFNNNWDNTKSKPTYSHNYNYNASV